MAVRLYKREATLTIAKPTSGIFSALQLPNATIISGLRIVFTSVKTAKPEPNTCEVVVYNLAEHTRALLQTKPVHVTLDAGYESNVSRIFAGDVRYASSVKDRVDWATTIQLGDGERAYRHARINKRRGKGSTKKVALKDLAASMGLTVPTSVYEAKEFLAQFAGGISLEGPSSAELTRLLKPMGKTWSVQGGQLRIHDRSILPTNLAAVVSQTTGMIGTPEYGGPTKAGESPTLNVSMLLNTELVPGDRIKMDSRQLTGFFRIERVSHTGDTHGQDWATKLEAKPL